MQFALVNKRKIRSAHECNQEKNKRGHWRPYREAKFLNIQATYQVDYFFEIRYPRSKIKINSFQLRGIPL